MTNNPDIALGLPEVSLSQPRSTFWGHDAMSLFGSLCETLKTCPGLPTDLWDLRWGVYGGLVLRPPTCTVTPQKKYVRSSWEKKIAMCSQLSVLRETCNPIAQEMKA